MQIFFEAFVVMALRELVAAHVSSILAGDDRVRALDPGSESEAPTPIVDDFAAFEVFTRRR